MDHLTSTRLQQFIFVPLKAVMENVISLVEAKIIADAVSDDDFIAWYYNATFDNATNANTWCAIDVSRVQEHPGRLSCRIKFWYYNQPDCTGIKGYFDVATGDFKVVGEINAHLSKFISGQIDQLVKQLVTDLATATDLPVDGIFGVQNWVSTGPAMQI